MNIKLMQSPSAETKDTSINVVSQNKTFEKIPSNKNIASHDKLLLNSNSANSFNMKPQSDLNPIYERFKKEQDNVDFIKTLLKLKQKNNKTNYNFQIALYEKEPTTSPLLHDDENDLHSQAIYHNIPMAKTYNKQNINKKKTKSTSLDTNLIKDKSRNTNIKVHKTNSKVKHEKKFSLQPKQKKTSQICTVRLSSPSPKMKIQSPIKLNEIKKAYNTERKNIFGNKAIISFHNNNGQKKFRSKRESSVPVTVINLFSENDIVVKTTQKNIKSNREIKNSKSSSKNSISNTNKNIYTFRKKTPVSSKFQFIKKTKHKENNTKKLSNKY